MPTSSRSSGNAPWAAIAAAGAQDETDAVRARLADVPFSYAERRRVLDRARELVAGCRRRADERSILDLFLQEFGLSNEEGIALMCISEALLRIPDDDTAEALIAEKIATANWAEHVGQSDSVFLNASTWALMLTGSVIGLGESITADVRGWINRLAGRLGESVARAAMSKAVRILGAEFVQGRTIEEALVRADGRLASFDMLGEGARTYADADRHRDAYLHAIRAIGDAFPGATPTGASGISIKLSALHPRYEPLQEKRVLAELHDTAKHLATEAASQNLHLTIDAEEAERLELSLALFELLAREPELKDWRGLGLAVQAYSKRAAAVIEWLADLGRPVMVRLVKGAYWDHEIKHAQVEGLTGYPVFTRKPSTDLAYIACAARLFANPALYPQFATHNAYTVSAVLQVASATGREYEFQRLHGMGELLYDEARRQFEDFPPVRVYAPVGPHKDLLAYLVRRLLENGANSSFVNRFLDDEIPVDELVRDPMTVVTAYDTVPHPRIPLPRDLFGAERKNSAGLDLGDAAAVRALLTRAHRGADQLRDAGERDVPATIARAEAAFPAWEARPAAERHLCFDRLADLIEADRPRFVDLLAREAGKTLADAVAEVREAADFCRYYGCECERLFGATALLAGPTGEDNRLTLRGRGVFACISPWNFPLAIFTGQVVAALAAGNTVVAKPAPQTPAVAGHVVKLMQQAGVPPDAVCLAAGDSAIGAEIVAHERISGVALTGSTATAKTIQRALAAKDGPIVPLIAETGGQNAMIVDSTALLEQVVDDCRGIRVPLRRTALLRVAGVVRPGRHRRAAHQDARRGHGHADLGRPGGCGDGCGPRDRCQRAAAPQRTRRALEHAHRAPLPPTGRARRHLLPAHHDRDRIHRRPRRRAFRTDPACGPFHTIEHAQCARRYRQRRFRAHPGRPLAHAAARRADHGRGARRQYVHQPGHGRGRGRRPAFRRRRPVGHRTEGRRTPLPAPFRRRTDRDLEHGCHGRQRGVVEPGRLTAHRAGLAYTAS